MTNQQPWRDLNAGSDPKLRREDLDGLKSNRLRLVSIVFTHGPNSTARWPRFNAELDICEGELGTEKKKHIARQRRVASTEPAKASIVDALIIMQEDFHSLSSFLPSLSQQLCRVTAPFWLAASHYNGSELEHASPALELVLIQASYLAFNGLNCRLSLLVYRGRAAPSIRRGTAYSIGVAYTAG